METVGEERRIGWIAPLAYLLMAAAAVVAFLVIRQIGEQMTPAVAALATPDVAASPSTPSGNVLLHTLLALAAVIVLGRIFGAGFRYVGQPPVIGEVLAGIFLGPSVLGAVAPAATAFVLPNNVAPVLGVIAQLGVVLYMFCVGLELDPQLLRRRGPAAIAISHASIVAPFVLGALVSLWLYPRFGSSQISFTVFALFLGVAMSVTAFPVLARILTDRGMANTPLGVMALSCAAADDATAWCLLAVAVGVAKANVTSGLAVVGLSLVYVAAMFWMVRPWLRNWASRFETEAVPASAIATVLLLLLVSALATEAIGIHAIFGGFLLGAIFPHSNRLAIAVREKIESLVTTLFLPAFFAFTGMRTELGLVSGWENWLWCGLIVVVATAGKLGGTILAARLNGVPPHEATSLGILMNTRGLMELVVLNIGLELRIISPTVFAMMVVMALVTTLATTPALHLLERKRKSPGKSPLAILQQP